MTILRILTDKYTITSKLNVLFIQLSKYWCIPEFTTWTTTIESANPIHLDFNIEARLLKTDDQLREQLSKISETISKHGNGMTTHSDISATLLPINLGN